MRFENMPLFTFFTLDKEGETLNGSIFQKIKNNSEYGNGIWILDMRQDVGNYPADFAHMCQIAFGEKEDIFFPKKGKIPVKKIPFESLI